MKNREAMPYSYHTFLFPFIWKIRKRAAKTMTDFCGMLTLSHQWKEEVFAEEGASESGDSLKLKGFPNNFGEGFEEDYAVYQYFTEPARRLIFGQGEQGCMRKFVYVPVHPHTRKSGAFLRYEDELEDKVDECHIPARYLITKGCETFSLVIQNIVLNVYETGVAMLILELENWENPHLDAVNKINEYGRRVCFPFLSHGSTVVTADQIAIQIGGEGGEVFRGDFRKGCVPEGEDFTAKCIHPTYIMRPLQQLLNGSRKAEEPQITASFDHRDSQKDWFIRPLIDDRMFVCCLVRDDKAFKKLRAWDNEAKAYKYLSYCDAAIPQENKRLDTPDEEKSQQDQDPTRNLYPETDALYKFLFIETYPTCQSRTMRKKILEQSVYDRWIDYGTLYGVTHHSFVCVTGEELGLYLRVIRPFLTIYVEMAKIALLACGSILALSESASDVADFVSGEKNVGLKRIEQLQERYVKAQSQIMLFEVTAQEQGVELYQMLSEQLYLEKNKDALSDQMSNLREVAAIRNDRKERESDEKMNLWVLLLTIVTTLDIILDVEPQIPFDVLTFVVVGLLGWLGVDGYLRQKKTAREDHEE